ncbi:MAG: winged helix-turn-helix transcriptional regulator [Solirubrobacterales bacterium]
MAAPLNVHILRTLEEGPKALLDLRRAVGSPPQSTMRLYSRTLTERGVIDRRRRSEFPGSAEYEITPPGRDLLGVADVLHGWLQLAPDGAVPLGSPAAKSATKALVEGWSTNIVRAIAARPLSLTELNRLIPKVSYPSLERRLGSMRLAGVVEPHPGDGRGTPYTATDWLRRAIVPLAAAANWERRHRPDGAQPIGRLDVEAAFLLAIPLVSVPADFDGKCRLAVELQGGSSPIFAGVVVCYEEGKVVSCSSRLEGEAEAWVSGSPVAWLNRLNRAENRSLELGGDIAMAEAILDGLGGIAAAPVS